MTPEQITLAYNIIIIMLFILIYVIYTQYREERNRRRFYQDRYYSEPRVHHYKRKSGWKLWAIFILVILSASCTKEESTATDKSCYQCFVDVRGIRKAIDTCVTDLSALDFKNQAGISLPWVCYAKN